MKNIAKYSVVIFFLILSFSCTQKEKQLVNSTAVSPWCILGFDTEDRTPKQRIAMLKEMGFSKYGYNKGKGHLDEMEEEFALAKENNIEISSIFLWLNAKRDSLGKLGDANNKLLANLKKVSFKPTIWVSFSDNFFKKLDHEASITLAVDMLRFIKLKADELGCKMAIYNHHGWFGNPYNQLAILKVLNQNDITMVYNFHHAHEFVDDFKTIAKEITPYLSYVNLNGVKKEGPQILPIGAGDFEYGMIKTLLNEGYKGPWGILGHIKTEDVQKVLKRNLEGLKSLNNRYNNEK